MRDRVIETSRAWEQEMSSKMRKYNHPKLYTVFPRTILFDDIMARASWSETRGPKERLFRDIHRRTTRKVEDPTGRVGVVDQKIRGSYFHKSRKKYVLRITLPNASLKSEGEIGRYRYKHSRRFCRYRCTGIIETL